LSVLNNLHGWSLNGWCRSALSFFGAKSGKFGLQLTMDVAAVARNCGGKK
jgi:hypothetical protein